MNRMVVMRIRFLDLLEKNRLNGTVVVPCGLPDVASLSPLAPPTQQTLSILFYEVRSATDILCPRVLLLLWTRHCIVGFLCCIVDGSIKCVPSRCIATFCFTITLERVILCCRRKCFEVATSKVFEVRR